MIGVDCLHVLEMKSFQTILKILVPCFLLTNVDASSNECYLQNGDNVVFYGSCTDASVTLEIPSNELRVEFNGNPSSSDGGSIPMNLDYGGCGDNPTLSVFNGKFSMGYRPFPFSITVSTDHISVNEVNGVSKPCEGSHATFMGITGRLGYSIRVRITMTKTAPGLTITFKNAEISSETASKAPTSLIIIIAIVVFVLVLGAFVTSLVWYKRVYRSRRAKKTRPPKKVQKDRPSLNEIVIKKEESKQLESPSGQPSKQTTKKPEAFKKSKKEEDDRPRKDTPKRKSGGKKQEAPKVEKSIRISIPGVSVTETALESTEMEIPPKKVTMDDDRTETESTQLSVTVSQADTDESGADKTKTSEPALVTASEGSERLTKK